jgi:hypothetical protein
MHQHCVRAKFGSRLTIQSFVPAVVSRYIANSACADGSIFNGLASRNSAAGSGGEQALGRLGGGTHLSTLAPHPTIDASTRGRGRIAHRSAELGYGRTAVDVVWITEGVAGSGEPRCRRRPWLLQQRRDLGVRTGRHHRHAAKADDLELNATGCRRDGTARVGLQSHARHEHYRHPAAPGGDEA